MQGAEQSSWMIPFDLPWHLSCILVCFVPFHFRFLLFAPVSYRSAGVVFCGVQWKRVRKAGHSRLWILCENARRWPKEEEGMNECFPALYRFSILITNYESWLHDPVFKRINCTLSFFSFCCSLFLSPYFLFIFVSFSFQEQTIPALYRFSILITNYESLLHDSVFKRIKWSVLVVDEAQRIKSPTSAVRSASLSIPHDHVLLLTGTPVQNHPAELWSLLNFIDQHR